MPQFKKKTILKKQTKKKLFFQRKKEKEKKELAPAKTAVEKVERVELKTAEKEPEEVDRRKNGVEVGEEEISAINRLIKEKSTELKDEVEDDAEPVSPVTQIETLDDFNGVSSEQEKLELVEAQLLEESRKAKKLEHELDLLKEEFKQEKDELQKHISELNRELHRTAPLHESKFFTLSREMRTAMEELGKLTKTNVVDTAIPEGPKYVKAEVPMSDQNQVQETKEVIKVEEEAEAAKKKGVTKGKVVKTVVASLLIFGVIGGAGVVHWFSKPEVDEALVSQYINQAGMVAGAQISQAPGTELSPSPPAEETADPLNDEVSLEQTKWETFQEPILGVQLQYPVNASKMNKTDSSVTFLRKTGYLLKIQRVETALEIENYWDQIKASQMNYSIETSTFRAKRALHLTLNDITDYPGNRYLVRTDKYIYDVWYATDSEKFNDDDIARVKRMLSSLAIVTGSES